jgi:hypothetical protein
MDPRAGMDVFATAGIRTPDILAGSPVNTPTALTRTRLIFENVIICSTLGHDDDDDNDNDDSNNNNNNFTLKETVKASSNNRSVTLHFL